MPEAVAQAAEHVEEFALVRDFAIIMAVAGLAVVIFRKLNQPAILGYLIAGVIVGPYTLSTPPVTNIESIRLLADLGLVLLLFAIGLEFGWRRIRQVGLSVLIIGTLELIVMLALGYQTGRFLSWTPMESIFLGAALAISSSAILIKVLRDTGRLDTQAGRLIVGILVVEDFIAVVLLTLLSGIATTGAASIEDVGPLVLKLTIFATASLTLGAIFVPRIISFVDQFKSSETMLLATLAMCFTLALIAQSLGISAAAGAFLIGAVVGDTKQAQDVERVITPVRDMFSALFFVSIGMLIDIFVLKDHLLPAIIISLVFIAGKIAIDTVGTFVVGQPDRTSLQVGMGMPQIGEFSLAMMKVGVEQNAIGAVTYQVVAAVTALNAAIYPYIAKSHKPVGDFLARVTPKLFQTYLDNLSLGLQVFRSGLSFDSEFSQRVRRSTINIVINGLIVVVLIGTGTFVTRFASDAASLIKVTEDVVGSGIGLLTLALCIPSGLAIWRSTRNVADETTILFLRRGGRTSRVWGQEALRSVIRDTVTVSFLALIALWSVPFVSELFALGILAVPLPLVIFIALIVVAIRTLTRIHGHLVQTFSSTFLGEELTASTQTASLTSSGVFAALGTPMEETTEARRPFAQPAQTPSSTNWQAVSDPSKAVSLANAEMIALTIVRGDLSTYSRRLGTRDIVWDIKESVETPAYYRILLSFRGVDGSATDEGEEEFYVDKAGAVQIRQIRSWPSSGSKRVRRWAVYGAILVVVASGVGVGGYFLAQFIQ
jgi:CPA2 family monovalent cation:H+ antiporter-2